MHLEAKYFAHDDGIKIAQMSSKTIKIIANEMQKQFLKDYLKNNVSKMFAILRENICHLVT